jgi:hypothetical protein
MVGGVWVVGGDGWVADATTHLNHLKFRLLLLDYLQSSMQISEHFELIIQVTLLNQVHYSWQWYAQTNVTFIQQFACLNWINENGKCS